MKHLLVLGALLVAGCASPAADLPDLALEGWEIENDVTGCSEQVGVLLVEPEVAQAALPEGFTAADAADLLDLPAATGQGAFFFNAVACEDKSAGELAVPVVAPQWDGPDLPEVRYSFYQLGYMNSDAGLVQRLQETGFPAFTGEAQSVVTTAALAAAGEASVAAGPLDHGFESALGAPGPMDVTARFWHVTDAGVVHLEYTFTAEAFKGVLTACRIAAGSLLHEASGRSDCQGEQTAALVFPSQAWDGVVRFTPGASVV